MRGNEERGGNKIQLFFPLFRAHTSILKYTYFDYFQKKDRE